MALIQAQTMRALGVELLVYGLIGSIPPLRTARAVQRITPPRPWRERLFHIVLGQVTASILNAWVLLIEILR